ncbi:MAG TPA: toll/interleukin-1 receptor domain-containing protein [Micropepsaceae bacterium]|nr:toll/interleukin-1 receptor domain-containing protein [Micropepsaceae bacterium]
MTVDYEINSGHADTDPIDIAASYSRKDAKRVAAILDGLRARGIEVWFDKNIPGGALWEEHIARNMRKAHAVIFFVSKDSLASDRCFDEVSTARTLKKPLIPLLLDPVRVPEDLPDRLVLTLQARNAVEAFGREPAEVIDALMAALAHVGITAHGAAASPAAHAAARGDDMPRYHEPVSGRKLLIAGGAGFAALAIAAILMFVPFDDNNIMSGAPIPVASGEWCGLGTPELLSRTQTIGDVELARRAQGGDVAAMTMACLNVNAQCNTGTVDVAAMAPAYVFCEKAAEAGNLRALFNKGWLLQRGCGVEMNGPAAARAFKASASSGCAIAQYYLGSLYAEGNLVGYNDAEAVRLFELAAAQDYPPALNYLAAMVAQGKGVAEDDARAASLYQRAAELGNAMAMFNLARAYERGSGVTQDIEAAIIWYRRASLQTSDQNAAKLAKDSLVRLGRE